MLTSVRYYTSRIFDSLRNKINLDVRPLYVPPKYMVGQGEGICLVIPSLLKIKQILKLGFFSDLNKKRLHISSFSALSRLNWTSSTLLIGSQ